MISTSTKEADEVEPRAKQIIGQLGESPLVEVLRALQREEGCLTEAALKALASNRLLSLTRLYGIASSYPEFRFDPESQEGRAVSQPVPLPGFISSLPAADQIKLLDPGVLTAPVAAAPATLDSYEAAGGMAAIRRALSLRERQKIWSQVEAALPAREPQLWQQAAAAAEEPLIFANGMVGDPLAKQASLLLRNDAYSVMEGMFVAAMATGAGKGFLLLDAADGELAGRLQAISEEVQRAANVNFALEILVGPETLVASEGSVGVAFIEGKRPVPAANAAALAVHGLWGKPTIVDGVEAFAALATAFGSGSKVDTRFYQVAWADGAVILEADPCTPVRDLLERAQAPAGPVLAGGLSGVFLADAALDQPLGQLERTDNPRWRTFYIFASADDIAEAALQIAAYNARYLCGLCVPCRVGSVRMEEILKAGTAERETLKELAATVEKTGLCATGRGAAALVRSYLNLK